MTRRAISAKPYSEGLTDEQKRLLGIDKEPEIPNEDKLRELAEKNLAEMERLTLHQVRRCKLKPFQQPFHNRSTTTTVPQPSFQCQLAPL